MIDSIRSKARIGLVGLLIAITPWGVACAQNPDTVFLTNFYNTLSQNKLLDKSYQAPVEKAFQELLSAVGFSQPLNLNGPYAAGALNVYLVNLAASDISHLAGLDEKQRQMLLYLRHNVLALPPNVVAFDSQFLADLVLNFWNEGIAVREGMEEARILRALGEPEEKGMERMEVHSVVGEAYRFNNIRTSRNNQSQNLADALSPAVSVLSKSGDLGFALAPVFYHELGHLHDNNFGSLFDFIDDMAQYLASYKVRRKEDAADKYAIAQLQRLFSQQSRESGNQASPLLEYQSVAATIKLFRDSALLDMFSGFRKMEAEDHFVTFIHKDCLKKPETADLNFYDPRKIDLALFQFVPLLTKDEFDLLRSKVLSSVRSATHAHNFIRGDHMVAALDELIQPNSPKTEQTFMQWYTLLLDSLTNDDPKRLYEYFTSGSTQGVGFGIDRFQQNLDLEFRPAVTCPSDMCMVGFFKDGQPGFVEIVGPLNNLRSIRVVYPLWGTAAQDVLSGTNADEYKQRLSLLQKFVLRALNVPSGSAAEQKLLSRLQTLLSRAKKCGTITFVAEYENRALFMTTVNPDFWVNIEVYAKSALNSKTQ